jgi:hypothetical protein
MTARTAHALATALAVAVLAGCGGSSPTASSPADSAAQAQALVKQTFGPNAAAGSGLINGTIDSTTTGVPGYEQPVGLSMSGPFDTPAGGGAPRAHLALGIRLASQIYGADMIFSGNDVLVALGPTTYQVPAALAATIRKPLADTGNPLGALLDVFAIAPGRWAAHTKIAGTEQLKGIEVVHATAGIDTKQFFIDAARFTRVLTSLRFTEIAGLPQVIDARMRAALVRSVTSATGDVYTGKKDHVVRRAHFDIRLRPSAADRKLLGGAQTMRLVGELSVTDVGAPQRIEVPSERGSYRQLQLTFDALAESARRKRNGLTP